MFGKRSLEHGRAVQRPVRIIAAALAALSLALSGAIPAAGQADAPAATPAPAAQSGAGPALWRVADADTTIYLFGTVHALPPDAVWMDKRIEGALLSSEELVTEIATQQRQDARAGMLQMAVLPEGQSLRAMLGEAPLRDFEGAMAGLGLPAASFDRFEPWYAAMALSLLPMARLGYSADAGVEAVLNARLAPSVRRGALETVEQQLALFDTLPTETQIAYLQEVSKGVPEMGARLRQMVAAWQAGDAEGLAALMNSSETDPVLLDRLLYQRNREWARWIVARLDQPGTVFLAVGAGHLAGPGSVQEALAREGFSAVRIP